LDTGQAKNAQNSPILARRFHDSLVFKFSVGLVSGAQADTLFFAQRPERHQFVARLSMSCFRSAFSSRSAIPANTENPPSASRRFLDHGIDIYRNLLCLQNNKTESVLLNLECRNFVARINLISHE
jgi:hypothetical protein